MKGSRKSSRSGPLIAGPHDNRQLDREWGEYGDGRAFDRLSVSCYRRLMRITLDIDDDVLEAARSVAARKGCTIGKALSDMARQALEEMQPPARFRNGILLLPDRPGAVVTMEDVNALREELP